VVDRNDLHPEIVLGELFRQVQARGIDGLDIAGRVQVIGDSKITQHHAHHDGNGKCDPCPFSFQRVIADTFQWISH